MASLIAERRLLCLEEIYAVPDPFDTLEAWERREHRDLAAMTLSEVLVERDRLRLRLLLDPKPDPWLPERLERVQRRLRAQ